jgi:hypothetical protein
VRHSKAMRSIAGHAAPQSRGPYQTQVSWPGLTRPSIFLEKES